MAEVLFLELGQQTQHEKGEAAVFLQKAKAKKKTRKQESAPILRCAFSSATSAVS